MNCHVYYGIFGAFVGALTTWALMLIFQPIPVELEHKEPRVSTEEVMGKCLQGQQVLYRIDRGRAAGVCAYDLSTDRTRFFRVWKDYETEEGSW